MGLTKERGPAITSDGLLQRWTQCLSPGAAERSALSGAFWSTLLASGCSILLLLMPFLLASQVRPARPALPGFPCLPRAWTFLGHYLPTQQAVFPEPDPLG